MEIIPTHRSIKKTLEKDTAADWLTSLIDKVYEGGSDALQISGRAGCGKSMLMGRLAQLVTHRTHENATILRFRYDSFTATQCSPLSLVKGLLLQLFDSAVGDLELYQRLCEEYRNSKDIASYNTEDSLWAVLKDTLLSWTQPVTIIVDGLDQLSGGLRASIGIRSKLHEISMLKKSLRCIVLVRPGFGKPPPGVLDYTLDMRLIQKEIRLYIESEIRRSGRFAQFSAHERDAITQRMIEKNYASFLEAKMLLNYIGYADSDGDVFLRLSKSSWLFVGERSFNVAELEKLTGHHFHGSLNQSTNSSISQATSYNAIVTLQNGRVQFIHPLVKDRLRELANIGRISLTANAAHKSVLLQSLAYIKSCLLEDDQPAYLSVSL
ncbi:hypothetical protein MMC25_006927 [Agyrium rufum]|nr:hypothetical protein [Agyrium rufum]